MNVGASLLIMIGVVLVVLVTGASMYWFHLRMCKVEATQATQMRMMCDTLSGCQGPGAPQAAAAAPVPPVETVEEIQLAGDDDDEEDGEEDDRLSLQADANLEGLHRLLQEFNEAQQRQDSADAAAAEPEPEPAAAAESAAEPTAESTAAAQAANYATMAVQQLKALCDARGITYHRKDRKGDLISYLNRYDENIANEGDQF